MEFHDTYRRIWHAFRDKIHSLRRSASWASRTLILRRVIVPSTMPFIMLGLRSAVPYAVIGAIVGEFIAASKGLGYFINYSSATFDSAGAFAGIFILLAFILTANQLMQRLERAAVKWKRSEGAAVQG